MPLRNMWSLHPGEVLVAEKIIEKIPGCQVYFPLRDTGIDLLVVRDKLHCSVQVKESKYHRTKNWHNSWHQVRSASLKPGPLSKKQVPEFLRILDLL